MKEFYLTQEEFLEGERYSEFRRMCRKLNHEARRLNIPNDLIYRGVSWDFFSARKTRRTIGNETLAL